MDKHLEKKPEKEQGVLSSKNPEKHFESLCTLADHVNNVSYLGVEVSMLVTPLAPLS